MKNVAFIIFLFISLQSFAKTETDTITTWQLYKDKNLKLNIFSDLHSENVRRKLLFKIKGKLIFTYIKQLKSGSDSIAISNTELRTIIGPNSDKIFTVEYTDDTASKGTVLFKLILSDNKQALKKND